MLLINPVYLDFIHSCKMNLGLSYIASSLRAKGKKTKLINCQLKTKPDYEKDILSSLNEYNYVGITTNAGNITSALEIAKFIRENYPQKKIVFGGPQATAVYKRLIPEYADIVVRGEGEEAVCELFDTDLAEIKGIAYWDNGLKVNETRLKNANLDDLSWPAHELFLDSYKYCIFANGVCAQVLTSRGCSFRCYFCSRSAYGRGVRLRNIDSVLEEIDYLINNLGVRYVEIIDECFTSFPARVKEFCEKLIRKNYKRVTFTINNGVRPDVCDMEMFALIKKAGFKQIRFGIESGSQRVLNEMNKNLDLSKVRPTVMAAKKSGLGISAYFMLGFPGETLKSMRQTIDFAKSLPLYRAMFAIAAPFAGSELYEIVRKKGEFLTDIELSSVSVFKASSQMPTLSAEDIESYLKKAYKEFYLRPGFMLKRIVAEGVFMLPMILKRFKIESKYKI